MDGIRDPGAPVKEYILKPTIAPVTLTQTSPCDQRPVPPRQPLPTAVIDPRKPPFKVGLDVHLYSARSGLRSINQLISLLPKQCHHYADDDANNGIKAEL